MSDTEECPHGAPCECDLLATIERLKGEWMNLSDIVGDPMSPTGPISGIDRIAMAWGAGYRDGCEDGYGQGSTDAARHAIKERVILQDLIAELLDHYDHCTDCGGMQVMAQRAEQRLREVQGE